MVIILLCIITACCCGLVYLSHVYGSEIVGLLQLISKANKLNDENDPTNIQDDYYRW
jgi:cell division protein FtsL